MYTISNSKVMKNKQNARFNIPYIEPLVEFHGLTIIVGALNYRRINISLS